MGFALFVMLRGFHSRDILIKPRGGTIPVLMRVECRKLVGLAECLMGMQDSVKVEFGVTASERSLRRCGLLQEFLETAAFCFKN